jgi:hypothetical protein
VNEHGSRVVKTIVCKMTERAARRPWLWGLLGLLLAATCQEASADPARADSLRQQSFREMAGERYEYSLDFLMFRNLAEGQLQMTSTETPEGFRAKLVARTLGVASWLSGERTQRYVSVMEADGAGGLRPVSHESSVHKRKSGVWQERQKRYRFDYAAGKVYQERGRDGTFTPGLVLELPAEETPVDILTAFYNLRAGVYGPLTPGVTLQIPTLTSRGISEIGVEALADKSRPLRPSFPDGGTLLRVWVDPEIFETGGAALYVWFDAAGRPARGVVENVIGLGDVHGHLREEPKQP